MTGQDAPKRPDWPPPGYTKEFSGRSHPWTLWADKCITYIERLEDELHDMKDRWWPKVMHCGVSRRNHVAHYWLDETFSMMGDDTGQWLCPGGRGVRGHRPKGVDRMVARIAELERFIDDIATHDDDVELVPPAEEPVVLSDNPDDMIDCYDDPNFVEPPAEEPDGSQCDTCDEYSDACDCVCAVEEREGSPVEEPDEATMGIEMLWPEEGGA